MTQPDAVQADFPPGPAQPDAIQQGLLVRLDVASGKDDEVVALLLSAVAMLTAESTTLAWYALRFGRGEYGVFNAFADETGRDAHVNGRIAQALADAAHLFDSPPVMEKVRVLAYKLPLAVEPVHKAVLLSFPAKSGHDDTVEQFLRDARALVEDEPGTIAWFAIKRGNGDYGIFDVFPDNDGRLRHLTGHVPRELGKHALGLIGGVPQMHLLDVVAERAMAIEVAHPAAVEPQVDIGGATLPAPAA